MHDIAQSFRDPADAAVDAVEIYEEIATGEKSRPVVYSALGSHATEFRAGDIAVDGVPKTEQNRGYSRDDSIIAKSLSYDKASAGTAYQYELEPLTNAENNAATEWAGLWGDSSFSKVWGFTRFFFLNQHLGGWGPESPSERHSLYNLFRPENEEATGPIDNFNFYRPAEWSPLLKIYDAAKRDTYPAYLNDVAGESRGLFLP